MPHRKAKKIITHAGLQVFVTVAIGFLTVVLAYSYFIELRGETAVEKLVATNVARAIIIFSMAWITLEFWRLQRVIASPRLSAILRKWFFAFLAFTILRIVAAIVDTVMVFMVGYTNVIATLLMHGYILYGLIRQRHVLEKKEPDSSGKRRISSLMEETVAEMQEKLEEAY